MPVRMRSVAVNIGDRFVQNECAVTDRSHASDGRLKSHPVRDGGDYWGRGTPDPGSVIRLTDDALRRWQVCMSNRDVLIDL